MGSEAVKALGERRCIAVAEARWMGYNEMFFNGIGDTRSEAENKAESYCRSEGATGCFIINAKCG